MRIYYPLRRVSFLNTSLDIGKGKRGGELEGEGNSCSPVPFVPNCSGDISFRIYSVLYVFDVKSLVVCVYINLARSRANFSKELTGLHFAKLGLEVLRNRSDD